MAIDDLHIPGTVLALAEDAEGAVGGFLHLAPSPAGGGWSLSAMRRRPDAPNGLTEFLVVETLAWARETGASELSLNFCALTDFLAPERVTTPLRRAVRRGILLADNVFQLERLYSFNRKFFPEWRRRYICVERLTDLPAVGLAYLHAESLLVPPGPWTRRREARRRCRRQTRRVAFHGMSTTRSIGRLSEIAQVMVRHGFGYFFEAHKLSDLLPGRSRRTASPTRGRADGASSARGQHLREVLDELGPTFVKFGQLLSTRPDVVPPDIVVELRGLQDDVRPFPFEQAERVIEEELGNTLERLFLDFEPAPVAAASIGQVHRATLPNGRRVAVKVQRPGAPQKIEADLGLLYQAARLARERIRALDFVDARQLVDEFARSIRQGARLPAGGAQRAELPPPFRRPPARPRAEGLLAVHATPRPDARVDRRDPARRPRPRHDDARGAARDRLPDHRGVDDDDLPARLLPRRPAPGEHPRCRRRQGRSASSTSARSGRSPTTT